MANPFNKDPLYTTLPMPEWKSTPLLPNELHRGDWWSVFREGEGYALEWVSGELAGRLKRIPIESEEARRLVAGEITPDEVLRAHGTG